MNYILDKKNVLIALKSYRNTLTEFDTEEMDYLSELVERDIELEESI